MKNKILIVDDEESIRWVLGTSLEKIGYSVEYGENGTEALDKISSDGKYSLVILDIKMPDLSGIEVLERIKERGVKTPVILITAQNTVKNAITGIKLGAYDYIAKPFDLEEVNRIVNTAVSNFKQSKSTKVKTTDRTYTDQTKLGEIVGRSSEMLDIYKTVGRVADKDITILITGESGTGKELITKAIHLNSGRRNGRLVSINVAAIPKDLIESELFGHEKGAFTGAQNLKRGRFEEAHRGTLHIDEIGEMSLDLQTKLLRVLEENILYRLGSETPIEVDVRIIATTNKDLELEVKNGKFREDLFYRLNAITINIPPLRKRKDDIHILTDFFNDKYSEELDIDKKVFSDEVIQKFLNYPWPGNVRELENTVKRLIVLSPDKLINLDHLKNYSPHIISTNLKPDSYDRKLRDVFYNMLLNVNTSSKDVYDEILSKVEKQLFEIILEKTGGNKKKAASILGINRNTLAKKLSQFKNELD